MSKHLKLLSIAALSLALSSPLLAEDAPTANTVVATVNGSDLVPGDIALIPLSTATQVGLSAV